MGPILLKDVLAELNERLKGGQISRVSQSDERNILLRVFIRGAEERLLISADPRHPRMHLTGESFVSPATPLRFSAFLRSRIMGCRIEGFAQPDGERVVNIRLARRNRLEAPETYTIVAELTGKSSNVILLDSDGVVLDAMRRFPVGTSLRAVEPGVALKPLPGAPGAAHEEGYADRAPGESWNSYAERRYSALLSAEAQEREALRLRRALVEAEKKLKRKLENLRMDLARAGAEAGAFRLGELLVQNLGGMRRGMKEAVVKDYTRIPPEDVTVPLDERLGPRENAERYFKRSRKAKTALSLLRERIPGVEAEIAYVAGLLFEWEEAGTPEDLDALEEEMTEAGLVKERPSGALPLRTRQPAEPVDRARSTDGFELLIGRNAKGNDIIVRRYARDGDIWLHALKAPGAHVLIRAAGRGKEITEETIREAAGLAAWRSAMKAAGKVEVMYTDARNVRKPAGARPGAVAVSEFSTIVAEPEEKRPKG
jgi:predicted ribosome quality control (RQC) complex YloA/Tae2 family protein